MSKARWIKLYYGIKESAVWGDALRLKAWIDILLSANYKDKEWFRNGCVVKVKRGQFITSIRKLAASWKVSPNTVRRILDQFVELNMIERDSDTGRYTLITIVKYGIFQDCNIPDEYTDEHTDEHSDEYTDEHTDGIQHKNIKNNKKEKKEEESSAPDGGPDIHGPAPEGWDDAKEASFQESCRVTPSYTRIEWWDDWGDMYEATDLTEGDDDV